MANGFFSGERAASASAANGSAACRAGTGVGDDRDPEAPLDELEPATIGAPAWLYRASKSGFDTARAALPDPGGVAGTAPNPAPPGLGAANGFVDAGELAAAAAANGSCTANGFEEGPGPGELAAAAAAAANGSCACC